MKKYSLILFIILGFCLKSKAQDCYLSKTIDGKSYLIGNNFFEAKIEASTAKIKSLINKQKGNVELVDSEIYWTFGTDGALGCTAQIIANTATECHISFTSLYNATGRKINMDMEIHYYVQKGKSGLYTYSVLNRGTYPADTLPQYSLIWKSPYDLYDKIYVDSARNKKLLTPDYFLNGVIQDQTVKATDGTVTYASKTGIAELYLDKTTFDAKEYKYSYSDRYYNLTTTGFNSSSKQMGVWMTPCNFDCFSDGPAHHDYMANVINRSNNLEANLQINFLSGHYGGSNLKFQADEKFKKIYGPVLLYLNSNSDPDLAWKNAKDVARAEQNLWPYSWVSDVSSDVYPASSSLKELTGNIRITDPHKPDVNALNAWVGISQLSNTFHNPSQEWQYEPICYQYWTKANKYGSFKISNIRPGNNYKLYVYNEGTVQEFSSNSFNITTTDPASISIESKIPAVVNKEFQCNVDRTRGGLVFEVGIPDRDTKEFAFGQDYFKPSLWDSFFANVFKSTDTLVYTYRTYQREKYSQWPYVHSAYFNPTLGTPIINNAWTDWPREINFPILGTPTPGSMARLTIALAGCDDINDRLRIGVNINKGKYITTINPTINDGSFRRAGGYGKYELFQIDIPVSALKAGNVANTITLSLNYRTAFNYAAFYDYISLEVPGVGNLVTDLEETEDAKDAFVKIFPNPLIGDVLSITTNYETAFYQYSIFDANGSEILKGKFFNSDNSLNTNQISLSGIKKGIYIIKIDSDTKQILKKFVKE